ncbi:MAG: hypothetical protein L0H15_11950 [Nitrosospira sp.]|nr:hypothetical protein [Nitrosospira sp.]
MNKSMAAILIGATLAVSSLPAGAHSEEYFDAHSAPHGGQMRMAGPYHLELIAKEKELLLYVTDHGDGKVATEGGIGKATIQIGKAKPKTKTSIKLEPAGDNMLKGTGDFSLTPETVIIVFLNLPEYEAQSARFTPLKPKAKSTKKTPDEKKSPDDNGEHSHHHMHH